MGNGATVGISITDGNGRLRLVGSAGSMVGNGRLRSARRRAAFEDGQPLRFSLRKTPAHERALFPLTVSGTKLGVLEVVAPQSTIERRWDSLGALAEQTALVVRGALDNEVLETRARTFRTALELSARLSLAETREEAVQAAAAVCHVVCEQPIAGWVTGEGSEMFLAATRGFPASRQRELWHGLNVLPRWDTIPGEQRRAAMDAFARAAGHERALALPVSGAVLMVAGRTSPDALLKRVQESVDAVLRRLMRIEWAKRREGQIDLGIAWTAHEVRSPLLGAKAAIERLLAAPGGLTGEGHDLLVRSRDELGQLAELIVPLLQWSAGGGTLRRRQTDLVQIVREAASSCILVAGEDRLEISGARRLTLVADPKHLRSAIANLIRNALAFSPRGAPVRVRVERNGSEAVIEVSDQGPGVDPAERESIFGPFVQGRVGRKSRAGRGLGLFIARRVIEAHNGSIWVEPTEGSGAVFRVLLPRNGRAQESSRGRMGPTPGPPNAR